MKKITLYLFIVLLLFNCSTPLPSLLLNITEEHVYGISQGNTLGPAKVEAQGESCTYSIIILSAFTTLPGRSISKAVEDGKIGRIASIDYKTVTILPILGALISTFIIPFNMDCVIVTGERANTTNAVSSPPPVVEEPSKTAPAKAAKKR